MRLPMEKMAWNKMASGILKAELVRRNISYDQLVILFDNLGIKETKASILNKMSRGTFQFSFVLQCAAALEITNIPLDILFAAHMKQGNT